MNKPTAPIDDSELRPDHRRSIATTAQIVEKTLNEIEDLLHRTHRRNITTVITDSYTDDERTDMLSIVAELRKANMALAEEFQLTATTLSEAQILRASTAYLWTVLMDSKPKKLKGFGKIPPLAAEKLERHIDTLIALVDKLSMRT